MVGIGSQGENSLQVGTLGQILILRNNISASPAGVLEGSGWIQTGGGWNNHSGVFKARTLCNEIREEGTGCSRGVSGAIERISDFTLCGMGKQCKVLSRVIGDLL